MLPLGNISSVSHLGNLVRQKRKAANLTQFELSALSFVGTRFVSELENGKSTLELGKVLQVLSALGLELSLSLVHTYPTITELQPSQKPGYKLLTTVHLEQFVQTHETTVPVFKKENTLFLPQNGADHSHILKLAPTRYKSLITNELFCTLLAKTVKLSVPTVNLLPHYENTLLLEKISINHTTPAQQQKDLLERSIFNYLIGNNHVESHSNMLCTLVYPDFTPTNNNKIDWEKFAKEKQIKLKLIEEKIKELREKILFEMDNTFEYIDKNFNINIDVIPKICQIIERRIKT